MKIQNTLNNQSGFTLVEVLISSLLFMIALLGASTQFVQQVQVQASVNLQLQSRNILNQVLSEFVSNPTNFPPFFNGDVTKPITYIACYLENGTPLANKQNSSTNFIGKFIDTTKLSEQIPDICPNQQNGFEAHITQFAQDKIYIDLVIITPPSGRTYKTPVTSYRLKVNLASTS